MRFSAEPSGSVGSLRLLAANPINEPAPRIADESFQVAQLMQATGTADAVAKMAARFAKGEGGLANSSAIARTPKSVVPGPKPPSPAPSARQPRIATPPWNSVCATKSPPPARRSTRRTPNSPAASPSTRNSPASSPSRPTGPALLTGRSHARLCARRGIYLPLGGTKDSVQFLPIKAKASEIQDNLAKVGPDGIRAWPARPRASASSAAWFNQALLAPAVPYLGGISHLLIVPDGALQSLPFGMLVARHHPPSPAMPTTARSTAGPSLRDVGATGRRFDQGAAPVAKAEGARSRSPASATRWSVRRRRQPRQAGQDRIATVFRGSTVRSASGQPLPTLEIADVEAIRKTPRLPETANELRAIGKALKAGPDSIWLQQKATETAVKGDESVEVPDPRLREPRDDGRLRRRGGEPSLI